MAQVSKSKSGNHRPPCAVLESSARGRLIPEGTLFSAEWRAMASFRALPGPARQRVQPSLRSSAPYFAIGRLLENWCPQGNSNPESACDYWDSLGLDGTAELRRVPIGTNEYQQSP